MFSTYHPGQAYQPGHRDAIIDADHFGPHVFISAVLFACCAFVSCIGRFGYEWTTHHSLKIKGTNTYRKDGIFIIAAMLAGVCYLSVVGIGTNQQLLSEDDMRKVRKGLAWYNCCYIVSLMFTKLSYLWTVRGMIKKRFPITNRVAGWVMWLIVGWAASAVIGMASSCGAAGPGLPGDNSCMDFRTFWVTMGALDIGTETFICFLPTSVTLLLDKGWHVKSGLLVTFLLRLAVSAAAVWRIICLEAQFQGPALLNMTFASVPTTIATELEVCLAVLTCNVLFVKGFIGMIGKARDFEVDNMPGFGGDTTMRTPRRGGLRHMMSARFGLMKSEDIDPEMMEYPDDLFANLQPIPDTPAFQCQFSESHAKPATPLASSPIRMQYKVPSPRQDTGSVDEHAANSFRITRDVSVGYEQYGGQSGRPSFDHNVIELDELPSVPHRPSHELARQWLGRAVRGRPATPQPDLDLVEEKEQE